MGCTRSDEQGRITAEGKALQALPLPPRLARMVVAAARFGQATAAAELAALLVERGLGGDAIDLSERVERFARERGGRAGDMRRLAEGWARSAQQRLAQPQRRELSPGFLLALAYPERIAKARSPGSGQYLLANGRGAGLEPAQRLAREPWLVVAEMTGAAQQPRIQAAAALSEEELLALAGAGLGAFPLEERSETSFDRPARALRTRAVRRYGALLLAERPLPPDTGPEGAVALAQGLAALGIGLLPWSKAQLQLRERVAFLRQALSAAADNPWPDLSDERLAESAADWLAPHLEGRSSLAAIRVEDLDAALAERVALGSEAAARSGGADAFHRADRLEPCRRLRSRGRPDHFGAGAGAVWPLHPSGAGRGQGAAGAGLALARPQADPDHPRPSGLLARLMVGGEIGDEGPLPAPPLARRPRRSTTDHTGQATRDVRLMLRCHSGAG